MAGPAPVATPANRGPWLPAAWLLVVAALVARFLAIGDAAWTYNEATYLDLARHPWWTSFYPDHLFVRHPPLSFLVLWLWRGILGETPMVMRAAALLATLAGTAFLVHGARRLRGGTAATWTAVALAASFPLHAYALEVGPYAFTFLAASAWAWARATGHPRHRVLLVLLCLTHLFGFLFLALQLWQDRRDLRTGVRTLTVPVVWMVSATVAAALLNAEGDIMRLGPLGQFLRSGGSAAQAVAVSPVVHAACGALGLWILNPWALRRAWAGRRNRSVGVLVVGGLLLAVALFLLPPYPRYTLLILPVLWMATLKVGWRPGPAVPVALAVALLSVPVGAWYLEAGPDPRAAGDVPGLQDWEAAVAALPPGVLGVATSSPPATAFYLMEQGATLTDRSQAPYRIGLGGEVEWVVRLDAPADIATRQDVLVDAWIVPAQWHADARIVDHGGRACALVHGLVVYAAAC